MSVLGACWERAGIETFFVGRYGSLFAFSLVNAIAVIFRQCILGRDF